MHTRHQPLSNLMHGTTFPTPPTPARLGAKLNHRQLFTCIIFIILITVSTSEKCACPVAKRIYYSLRQTLIMRNADSEGTGVRGEGV
jgi:hypothetical protein